MKYGLKMFPSLTHCEGKWIFCDIPVTTGTQLPKLIINKAVDLKSNTAHAQWLESALRYAPKKPIYYGDASESGNKCAVAFSYLNDTL